VNAHPGRASEKEPTLTRVEGRGQQEVDEGRTRRGSARRPG